ncbi:MAG: DNA-directed RNA polymerase subunit omega [Chloracidobacterium sp.]|nr:DNA-directed RNA polymerase subunit omega [Chloracidobacterium sp.]
MKNVIGDNRFLKVLITAQRARQIHKGAHQLVEISNTRATRIALEEVERGLIRFEFTTRNSDSRCGPDKHPDNHDDSRRGATGEANREVDLKSVAGLGD